MRWCTQRWPLVTSGEVGSHQLSGIDSCYVCSEGLQPKQRRFSHPSEAGQQDSSVICKSHGRDSLSSVEQCDYPTMDMVPGERNNIISRASTGGEQLYSRHKSRTIHPSAEWQLRKDIFQDLMQEVYQCDVDLFASRLNHQLPQFISWRPDPYVIGTDTLQVPWTRWRGYAFPPFALISKVLRKVRKERSTILLIAPVWESQPWYPTLLSMLVDFPTLLPIHKDLLTDTFGQHHPLMLVDQLQLAAPARIYNRRHFCRSRTVAVFQDGVRAPTRLTRVPGRSWSAGVSHGTWIPFCVLSIPSWTS